MMHILPYHIDDLFLSAVGIGGLGLSFRLGWWMFKDWMKGGR